MKILVVSHHSGSLINFRGELLEKFVSLGHEVFAIAPDDSVSKQLQEMNIKVEVVPIDKQGLGIIENLKYLTNIIRCIRKYNIEVVFGYTVKPIVFGGLASWMTGIKEFYSMVEGLGGVFTEPFDNKKLLLQAIVKKLYKIGFKVSKKVFLLNNDDLNDLTKMKLLKSNKAVVIPGIGVNLDRYKVTTLPAEPIFLIIARLVYSKGIIDYCEAAKIVKRLYPETKFNILGGFDNKDDAISKDTLQSYIDEGIVCYLGETSDVREHIENSSIFVLPSYYREGMPRSILEAMAMGRPIITTDNVGCRDTVDDGVNGYIVPKHSPKLLADRMIDMVNNSELRSNMGLMSYKICKERYDVHKINDLIVQEMNLLKMSNNNII